MCCALPCCFLEACCQGKCTLCRGGGEGTPCMLCTPLYAAVSPCTCCPPYPYVVVWCWPCCGVSVYMGRIQVRYAHTHESSNGAHGALCILYHPCIVYQCVYLCMCVCIPVCTPVCVYLCVYPAQHTAHMAVVTMQGLHCGLGTMLQLFYAPFMHLLCPSLMPILSLFMLTTWYCVVCVDHLVLCGMC